VLKAPHSKLKTGEDMVAAPPSF